MAVKTRAQLKAENATDFPTNLSGQISADDLRGQMDDVADSVLFPEDDLAAIEVTSTDNVTKTLAAWTHDVGTGVPGPPGPAGDVRFVADIAAMRALTGLQAGSLVFVGSFADQFVVVNDTTLGTDGGTVFIPNSELSTQVEEVIAASFFAGASGANVAMEKTLLHTGIDFESVKLVLTNDSDPRFPGGETIDIWGLHGHVFSPIVADRANTPQLPIIDTARGKMRDPYAGFTGNKIATQPPVRTGGAVLRYKYALSSLRLKRITNPVFELRWWGAIAVSDEQPGVQTDNSGRICWAANAAAKAKAEALYIDKMYHYARVVEWPEGVELRGNGPGVSGFRVMDNMQHTHLLLSSSSDGAAADPGVSPLLKAATRQWAYDFTFVANATAFLPASGAKRIRISGIEFDGNIANNLRFFSQQNAEYAFTYGDYNVILFNSPTSAAFAITNQALRVIPEGQVLELHNVKMHGYAHPLLGNDHCICYQTGLLELGDCLFHWIYLLKGTYEAVRCFGYCGGDGLRIDFFVAKSVEMVLYPFPAEYWMVKQVTTLNYDGLITAFVRGGTLTGATSGATGTIDGILVINATSGRFYLKNVVGTFVNDEPISGSLGGSGLVNGIPAGTSHNPATAMALISRNEPMPQMQYLARGYPYPELSPMRVVIDHFYLDATQLDNVPVGGQYTQANPFLLADDNIHIRAGKMRFGSLIPAQTSIISTSTNSVGGHPYRNQLFENLLIEYGSRKGLSLLAVGTADGGYANVDFRNISIEQRASTHTPGNPGPNGISSLLGAWRFHEHVHVEPVPPNYAIAYDGRDVEFSGVTVDASLNGKYIDVTPPDPLAPMYRLWFYYAATPGAGSPPAAGGNTLIQVYVASAGATPATVAQAFSLAIDGTTTVPGVPSPYLTAATFNTKSAIGAFSHYRSDATATTKGGYVGCDVTNAAGVTTVLRTYHRNYEPSMIHFERFVAADPIYIYLMNITEIGPHRDLYFSFKQCVLASWQSSYPTLNSGGSFAIPAVVTVRDQVHFSFEDTVLDFRDASSWTNWDLVLYSGKFKGCRFRTPSSITGIAAMGAGYEVLQSEQNEVYTVTPTAGATTIEIQTKLFWVPKPGNLRVYPIDTQAASVWNTIGIPSIEWRKSARPVGGASVALGGSGAYYSVNEDRRAPVLRLTFPSALAATSMQIGWSAAVSS